MEHCTSYDHLRTTHNIHSIRDLWAANLLPIYTLNIPSDEADHNRHRRREQPSDEELKEYVKKIIEDLTTSIDKLQQKKDSATTKWNQCDIPRDQKDTIEQELMRIIEAHRCATIQKKEKTRQPERREH